MTAIQSLYDDLNRLKQETYSDYIINYEYDQDKTIKSKHMSDSTIYNVLTNKKELLHYYIKDLEGKLHGTEIKWNKQGTPTNVIEWSHGKKDGDEMVITDQEVTVYKWNNGEPINLNPEKMLEPYLNRIRNVMNTYVNYDSDNSDEDAKEVDYFSDSDDD